MTTASGGTEVGSLRWAASQATGGEIIRFAPNVASEIIRLSGPVVALTLEHSPVYWNQAYTGAGILGLDITLINSIRLAIGGCVQGRQRVRVGHDEQAPTWVAPGTASRSIKLVVPEA